MSEKIPQQSFSKRDVLRSITNGLRSLSTVDTALRIGNLFLPFLRR